MVASPNNTIIKSQNTILTDANGNQWFINSSGQIVVNGVVDRTTGNVQILAYENGRVWQMNASDLWWAKTLPTDAWGQGTVTSPLVGVASPNGDRFTTLGPTITDTDDNIWSITASGQVSVNGVADPTTGRVDELAYYNGSVWQKNADNNWYSKTSAASTWVYSNSPTPPVPILATSYNDTQVTGGSIIDANGNQWSIANGPTGTPQVVVDNAFDPTTANVVELAYVAGNIWQENTAGLWFSKTTPASAWSSGTTMTPITGTEGLPSSLIWLGGGNNSASNSADWSPGVVPHTGEVLQMASGTMNIVGNALAGDTLTIEPGLFGPSGPLFETINTSGAASLNISLNNEGFRFTDTMAINVAPGSTLTLNATVLSSHLTVSGGTVAFTGASGFAGSIVLDDDLVGSGTVTIYSQNTAGAAMEINGSVGSGLSFIMGSLNATSDLTIDHPDTFKAAIDLTVAPVTLGHVEFVGLQATSAEMLNGVLDMFNGAQLVDATRLSNPAGLGIQLHQTAVGVVLTAGLYNDTGNAGAIIPVSGA